MKQTSFLVEIVLTESNPTIIVRDPRGQVIKVTTKPSDLTSFCDEVISRLENISSTVKNSTHE